MIGLPNIIAGKNIVPELIQNDATAQNYYQTTKELLKVHGHLDKVKDSLKAVKEKIAEKDASKEAALKSIIQGKGKAVYIAPLKALASEKYNGRDPINLGSGKEVTIKELQVAEGEKLFILAEDLLSQKVKEIYKSSTQFITSL